MSQMLNQIEAEGLLEGMKWNLSLDETCPKDQQLKQQNIFKVICPT